MDVQLQEQMQELQFLEQQMQQIGAHKQALQVEQAEVANATKEVSATNGEVYKIVAGIMVKADKQLVLKELAEKEKQYATKLKALEQQEQTLVAQGEHTRKALQSSVEKQKKKA